MTEKLDGNKTALTHRVAATAVAYLASFGCKPVETEVPVGYGWVADVASFWYPTKTEAKQIHLPQMKESECRDCWPDQAAEGSDNKV